MQGLKPLCPRCGKLMVMGQSRDNLYYLLCSDSLQCGLESGQRFRTKQDALDWARGNDEEPDWRETPKAPSVRMRATVASQPATDGKVGGLIEELHRSCLPLDGEAGDYPFAFEEMAAETLYSLLSRCRVALVRLQRHYRLQVYLFNELVKERDALRVELDAIKKGDAVMVTKEVLEAWARAQHLLKSLTDNIDDLDWQALKRRAGE